MTAWDITAKDLHLLARDRRTFAMLLLLPLVFIVIIGLTTGKLLGWQSSNRMLKIAVVDATDYDAIGSAAFLRPPGAADDAEAPTEPLSTADREAERNRAKHIIANVLNAIQRDAGLEVRTTRDWQKVLDKPVATEDPVEAARYQVADGDVNAALIFTPEFYRKIYHLRVDDLASQDEAPAAERFARVGVEVVQGEPESSTASAIAAIVGLRLQEAIQPLLVCRSFNWTIAERATARYRNFCGEVNRMGVEPAPELLPPQQGDTAEGDNEVYEELVPSYTVMFVFFLVNIMARSFLHERELGTMRRLRIAPIPRWSVLAGKTIPFLIVSLLQTAILFLAGRLLFGMAWGAQPWMLLPVIFATSCAATGLGLLIATLVRSEAQVSAYATTVMIVLAGISGCFMPRRWLPDIMQQISLATPHAWALIAYDQLLAKPTPDLNIVWNCVGMLAAFAVGFFVLGGVRFGKVD